MYTTNFMITKLEAKDPIMKEIINSKEKYEISPVNAVIEDNYMIPGLKGVKVNQKKTYQKMKNYGTYNESMTILTEDKPVISSENIYDQYLIKGNSNKRSISLIFNVTKDINIKRILEILKQEEVPGNFFLDGSIIEKNTSLIHQYKENEYEVLSYNNKYSKTLIKASISYLESITNEKNKYCLTEKENVKLLNICKKEKYHTLLINYKIKENLYYEIKKNLSNGYLFLIEINPQNEKELSPTIEYIKSKGYKILKIKELLSE